jgi:hypothetical protein
MSWIPINCTARTWLVAFATFFAVFFVHTARVYAAAPATTVGVYIEQVANVDLKANQFTVDFWIWFRSTGRTTSPVDSFEIIDGRVNSRTNLIKKKMPNGEDYASVRINATIHRQWDLRRYPFDDHALEIVLEDAEADVNRMEFVPDPHSQGIDPDVAVAGWDVKTFSTRIERHSYASNYGDLSIASGDQTVFSRFVFSADARRVGSARFIKVTFTLLISVLVSWCAFFVRPKDASPRVSVSVGALFAGAASTAAINSQLPDVGYATLTDKVVFLSLGMILLSLVGTVIALTLHYSGKESVHRTTDRIFAVLFPVVFVAALLAILS